MENQEVKQEDNVVSLDEFRKRHPVPSGRLLKDPYNKKSSKRINQDKSKGQRRSNNYKLDEAMRKYGSLNGTETAGRRKIKKTEIPEK